MAEEVVMTPVDGAEPPKPTPIVPPAAPKPAVPGATATGLRPGLKLPPRTGTTVNVVRSGLKLPPKPGATVSALRPGIKLPTKPVIHKPGEAPAGASSLPKPLPKPIAKPVVSVDAQGIGKLPTVQAAAVPRDATLPDLSEAPKPMESLKSVTQKLKGITQAIPPQAVLHKTGIISEGAVTEAQKEAAKHKTARISLSDAMGVAPVKTESQPMKTIKIKRPVDIPAAVQSPSASAAVTPPTAAATAPAATAPAANITQRKTLKITRPTGGTLRPTGKFGKPTQPRPAAVAAPKADDASSDIPDIADIPEVPSMMAPQPTPRGAVDTTPAWVVSMATIVQLAACGVLGAVAYFLYENTQTLYF